MKQLWLAIILYLMAEHCLCCRMAQLLGCCTGSRSARLGSCGKVRVKAEEMKKSDVKVVVLLWENVSGCNCLWLFQRRLPPKPQKGWGFCCCLHPLPLPNHLSPCALHRESLTYLERVHVSFHHYGSLSRKLVHAITGKL